MNDNEAFSEEYALDNETQSLPSEQLDKLDIANGMETDMNKYGLSKPERYKIKGKITHDQD